MTTNDDRLIDPFIDWLDASVAGTSTPDIEAGADSELTDIRTAASQFHGLDARLERYAVDVSPRSPSWEDLMYAHPDALEPFGAGATDHPVSTSPASNVVAIRPWERAANVLLIAGIVLALAAGLWRAADMPRFGIGNDPPDEGSIPFGGIVPQNDGDTNTLVPVATVPVDLETSSIPYPTADECVVEPMTREQVIQHFQEANTATAPERATYERPIEPSGEDAAAIMQTFREWQACQLNGRAMAYSMQFETTWYTANHSSLFYHNGRPVTDEMIADWADIVLGNEGAPSGTPMTEPATPPSIPATPAPLPLPENATPVAMAAGGVFSQTIFQDDIIITGPDTAVATTYFVNSEAREISVASGQVIYEYVKVDGQWLIDAVREGVGG